MTENQDLIGFVYKSRISDAENLANKIVEVFKLDRKSWISTVDDIENITNKFKSTSFIVVLGGDGTILKTAQVVAPFSIPIVGVNMGRVGFMTELKVDEVLDRLPIYMDGSVRIEERMMIKASVLPSVKNTEPSIFHALNDIVIGRPAGSGLVDVNMYVNDSSLANYRADAVVFATATGSTGYSLSTGGSIIYPDARVVTVQPVAPHTGLRHGLIFSEDTKIELYADCYPSASLHVDGSFGVSVESDAKVLITPSPYVTRFLRSDTSNEFYTDLMKRLELIYRLKP